MGTRPSRSMLSIHRCWSRAATRGPSSGRTSTWNFGLHPGLLQASRCTSAGTSAPRQASTSRRASISAISAQGTSSTSDRAFVASSGVITRGLERTHGATSSPPRPACHAAHAPGHDAPRPRGGSFPGPSHFPSGHALRRRASAGRARHPGSFCQPSQQSAPVCGLQASAWIARWRRDDFRLACGGCRPRHSRRAPRASSGS